MARNARINSEAEISWNESFALHREQLRFYLDYLIECECSDSILAGIEEELRGRPATEEPKFRLMATVLARRVIDHMRESGQITETMPARWRGTAMRFSRSERLLCFLIYLLRDILGFSTRDTSSLIGFKDADVEKILSATRKHIDMHEGPSSLEIEFPTGSYLRWRFADLHLRS